MTGSRWCGRSRWPRRNRRVPTVPHPNLWFVPQWRTEEILRARLSGYGRQVQWGNGVAAVEQCGDAVTVRLHSGETVRAAYLVGADGGRSAVRRQLAIPFLGITDDEVQMLQADVRAEGLDHEYGHGWMLDGRCFFGFTPLAGGEDTFVVNTTAPGVQPTLPALQAIVEAASKRTDIRLHEPTWATIWRSNVRLAQRFRIGRAFLAGDAAHVHPPTGGQGINTGVQDAYNLGWKLPAALTGTSLDVEALLDSYQAERLPIAARALGISTELLDKTLSGSDDALHRGEETRQLDLNYRGGPLTLDDGCSGMLAAGDRAPDAPCQYRDGRPARLFGLFAGPHWTLLRFGPDAPRLDHPRVHAHQIGTDVLDPERHIYRAYDVKEGGAVLVRPDGYIGAITTQSAALADYGNWCREDAKPPNSSAN